MATLLAAALILPALPAYATPAESDNRPPHPVVTPTLNARATLAADHLAEGPPSGAEMTEANGRTGPLPGQVIPGFSAAVDKGDGTFWAMPDNGFGNKSNSADFLLRIYQVEPVWERDLGGPGEIRVQDFVQLRDPDNVLDFDIVNENTEDRLLTGNDFDVESLVMGKDGSFWIGEEFGPFVLHFSADGVLLDKPVEFPYGKSPDSPVLAAGEAPDVRRSKGFEGMSASSDGRYLYPMLEGHTNSTADKRRRLVTQFDTESMEYTDKTWSYLADTEDSLIADAFTVSGTTMLILERDDFDGAEAVIKRVYSIDLQKVDSRGYLEKELVVDLLKISNPYQIGTRRDPGAYGIGDPFSFPMQSVEVMVQLSDGRLLIGNDNNYPGNDSRRPGQPDDTELIVVDQLATKTVASNPHTVIAHRGASGYRPEHTLAAYELAIQQCADYIEPDLVSTRDGALVDRHENEIGGTTDVATRGEFADRRTTKNIDGHDITGWFTEDFTLAELRTLRAKERLPDLRPGNTAFDGLYQVPTFDEVVDLARHSRTCDGKPVGIAPEIKHGSYFQSIGLPQEDATVAALERGGFVSEDDRAVIQSFEVGNLRYLDTKTEVMLAQLIDCSGAPADLVAAGSATTYQDMVTPAGLEEIAAYADQAGLCKDVMIPKDPTTNELLEPTPVLADAEAAGLTTVGWTFRAENSFLPADYQRGTNPAEHGDLKREIQTFLEAGMDVVFSDHPDVAVRAVRDR